MNVGVVAPQSSHWEDSHRAAAILVKAFQRLGHRAWLITSVYHDDAPALDPDLVEKSERGFVEVEKDVSGVSAVRVLSSKPLLPGGGVVLRNFSKVLGEVVDVYGLDVVVVFSSFWNGPEEAAKWVTVRRSLLAAGEPVKSAFFVYVPVYYAKFHVSRPVEYASRVMWATLNLPHILRLADLVVVCCGQEATELRRFGLPPERVVESNCWVDPDLAEILNATPSKPFDGFDYVVSYIGPLGEGRNVQVLLRAADKLQTVGKVGVVVAGVGEAAGRIRKEGKRGVVLVDRHDPEMIASIIKSSVAGVDPSSYEPMGIRALEYMYAGVPFAAAPGSRAVWYITDGVDGVHLNNAEDVEGLVRWVATLIKKPEVREEMGKKAQKKAEVLVAVKLADAVLRRLQRL
jgi:Glycosyltransferase